jgi:hypothetical protein
MVKAYSADANMRDNSGKKPRQYMKSVIGAYGLHNLSNDTFRQVRKFRKFKNKIIPNILTIFLTSFLSENFKLQFCQNSALKE